VEPRIDFPNDSPYRAALGRVPDTVLDAGFPVVAHSAAESQRDPAPVRTGRLKAAIGARRQGRDTFLVGTVNLGGVPYATYAVSVAEWEARTRAGIIRARRVAEAAMQRALDVLGRRVPRG